MSSIRGLFGRRLNLIKLIKLNLYFFKKLDSSVFAVEGHFTTLAQWKFSSRIAKKLILEAWFNLSFNWRLPIYSPSIVSLDFFEDYNEPQYSFYYLRWPALPPSLRIFLILFFCDLDSAFWGIKIPLTLKRERDTLTWFFHLNQTKPNVVLTKLIILPFLLLSSWHPTGIKKKAKFKVYTSITKF